MTQRIVGFSGSLGVPSKTRALVDLALSQASARFGAVAESYDMTELLPSLITEAGGQGGLDAAGQSVLDKIISADALVVGSPVYKGSYTGLFKHVFDLIDPRDLAGKPVLLTATGGGDKHALVIEHHLRPLFGFFEAATLAGIYAGGADFADGKPSSPALLSRLDRAIDQFSPWLGWQNARAVTVAAE
ncbi:NAD(P)H-dependent oxidoreductase [Devosia sediminis]|uniref:NAD(P)H-dependent oxidoreductase n=1 Tax=Devosia sediminis TaxID=2798801 RepID=A0A934IX06_9HYPH|nr:NAD(P)H-dependent oxidoreductase [Devosia sediminis]MBJ3783479.1 NAD(P)H-dependent oxidoreductase [Devosia sediminis]